MLCRKSFTVCQIVVYLLLLYRKGDVFAGIEDKPSNPTSVVVGKNVTFQWTTSATLNEVTWGIKKPTTEEIETTLIYVSGPNVVKIRSTGDGEKGESYKGRITFTGNLSNKIAAFKITNVQPSDAVEYGCQLAESGQSDYVFSWARLEVTVPANVTHPQVKSYYTKGEKVNITCQATGIPVPTVKWTRMRDNKDYPSSFGVAHLGFSSVQKEDAGKYTCNASNKGGSAQTEVNVVVYYAPTVTADENPKIVYEIGKNELICNADANPPPEFTWTKDGLPITENVKLEGSKSILTLPSVSRNSNGDSYTCAANNSLGTNSITIVLKFGGKDPPTTQPTSAEVPDTGARTEGDDGILIGAIVGALVGVILIVVIIVYILKCRKGGRGSRSHQGMAFKERGTKSVSDIDDYEPATGNHELPEYASVDRSKKKPRKPDLNYAQIDHGPSERSVDRRPTSRTSEPTTYAEIVQTWEPTNDSTYANVPRRGVDTNEML